MLCGICEHEYHAKREHCPVCASARINVKGKLSHYVDVLTGRQVVRGFKRNVLKRDTLRLKIATVDGD